MERAGPYIVFGLSPSELQIQSHELSWSEDSGQYLNDCPQRNVVSRQSSASPTGILRHCMLAIEGGIQIPSRASCDLP